MIYLFHLFHPSTGWIGLEVMQELYKGVHLKAIHPFAIWVSILFEHLILLFHIFYVFNPFRGRPIMVLDQNQNLLGAADSFIGRFDPLLPIRSLH